METPSPAVAKMATDILHSLKQDNPDWAFDPSWIAEPNYMVEVTLPWNTVRALLIEVARTPNFSIEDLIEAGITIPPMAYPEDKA